MPSTPASLDTLFTAMRNAPYAFHGEADVEKHIARLSVVPLTRVAVATVAEALDNDARVHDECGNYQKAEIVGALANRVWALS